METQKVLEELRANGWSDQNIAEALGVSPVTVWQWRTGKRTPRPEWMYLESLERLLRQRPPGRRRRNRPDSGQGGEKPPPHDEGEACL
jgi:transcriptional regulator with XRE-family HTH domain